MTLSPESRSWSGELTRLPDFTIPPYALPPRTCLAGFGAVSNHSNANDQRFRGAGAGSESPRCPQCGEHRGIGAHLLGL